MRSKLLTLMIALMVTPLLLSSANAISLLPGTITFQGTRESPHLEIVPNVVDHEPNNDCNSATPWPDGWAGISSGALGLGQGVDGSYDNEDWSKVRLYRTETLSASIDGAVLLEYADPDCAQLLYTDVEATKNGMHRVRVQETMSGATAPYVIKYGIKPNDPNGADVGNTRAEAFALAATPEALTMPFHGAVPARTQAYDEDWYKISAALVPEAGEPIAAGLLTVSYDGDCAGSSTFAIYQADGLDYLYPPEDGCGLLKKSCIAIGGATIYAQARAGAGGDAYTLTATMSPLHLVTTDVYYTPTYAREAVYHATRGDIGQAAARSSSVVSFTEISGTPWCDPAAPLLLSLYSMAPSLLPNGLPVGDVASKLPNAAGSISLP